MQASFDPNPRAVVGGNFPPDDDDDIPKKEDKSPPTVEEARLVAAAISYIQYKNPRLADILTKRKAGVKMGWRHLVANALKERVRQNSLADLLHLNRKTVGENQQRPDAWARYDDEEGTGEFGCLLADLRDAIISDAKVDVDGLETYLKVFVKADPKLRELEEQERACLLAAKAADEAANALEARRRARAADAEREARTQAVRKALKGVPGKAAIVASHQGAEHLAKTISREAMGVVEVISKAEAKGVRRTATKLDATGLRDCIRLGLARESQPYLAPPTDDPPIAVTELCLRVFQEGLKNGRIKAPKKKEGGLTPPLHNHPQ